MHDMISVHEVGPEGHIATLAPQGATWTLTYLDGHTETIPHSDQDHAADEAVDLLYISGYVVTQWRREQSALIAIGAAHLGIVA